MNLISYNYNYIHYFAGASLGKGLNRMLATGLAGAVGVATNRISTLCGEKGKAVLTSVFVFVIGIYAS